MSIIAEKKEEAIPNFRDRMPLVTEKGRRKWIYARKPSGKWYNSRSLLSIVYLAVFFGLPFLRINNHPALQINIPEGKFIILGHIFWPQDFFIFGLGMVAFIVFIYLFTMIYGRVFCGWACPQTIFMEMVFRKVEWLIEGPPARQRQLKQDPYTFTTLRVKALKHLAFFAIAFLIANTFLAYIIGINELYEVIASPLSKTYGTLIALLIFSAVFYAVYAFAREIICVVVCPYGRLQSVLLDKNSIIVAYDYQRGEPRKAGKRSVHDAYGDCIDCHQCVDVCPTGIDIRNGTQLECINCTACIDACNNVMQKMKFPKGLLRFASENEIASNRKFRFSRRMQCYTAVLFLLVAGLTALLLTQKNIEINVMRTRGQLYQEVGNDSLSNLYQFTVLNKTSIPSDVEFRVEQHKDARIKMVGANRVIANAEMQTAITAFIILPKWAIKKRDTELRVGMYKNGKQVDACNTRFLGYTN